MRTIVESTVEQKILARMKRLGEDAVVIAKDFFDFGSREAVDKALSRLVKAGTLQRVLRGIYYKPRPVEIMGHKFNWSPTTEAIVEAITRQTGERLMMAGGTAANQLGLSEQVPMRAMFLTSGRSRVVTRGKQEIIFRHVPPKDFPKSREPRVEMFLNALRNLGPGVVQEPRLQRRLQELLTPAQRRTLLDEARHCPEWIREVAREAVHHE
jgi:hypothetical protein